MAKYAAFLRGVNLGPHRRISNADLRAHFEKLGFAEVAAFRSSGNVAFTADGKPGGELEPLVERGLSEAVGFDVGVFLRSAAEIDAIAADEPFERARVDASSGKLQVALLRKLPAKRARDEVLALATDDDLLAFGKRELYWLPSGGLLESGLDLKAIGKLVGVNTRRTMGTMRELAAKHFSG